jgi:hypothetical protein
MQYLADVSFGYSYLPEVETDFGFKKDNNECMELEVNASVLVTSDTFNTSDSPSDYEVQEIHAYYHDEELTKNLPERVMSELKDLAIDQI